MRCMRILRTVLMLCLPPLLVACGGGGGGSSPVATPAAVTQPAVPPAAVPSLPATPFGYTDADIALPAQFRAPGGGPSPVPLDNTGQAKPVGQEPDLLYVYPYEQKNFSNLLADLRI